GWPTHTGPSPAVTCRTADQIVVSVGPYMFQTDEARLTSSFASSRGKASPPHRTLSTGSPFQPASSNCCHVTGVAWTTVASTSFRYSSRRTEYCAVSRLTMASLAPTQSGRKSSSPEISNDSVVTAARTSELLNPGRICIACNRLTTALCGTSTPLGLP